MTDEAIRTLKRALAAYQFPGSQWEAFAASPQENYRLMAIACLKALESTDEQIALRTDAERFRELTTSRDFAVTQSIGHDRIVIDDFNVSTAIDAARATGRETET